MKKVLLTFLILTTFICTTFFAISSFTYADGATSSITNEDMSLTLPNSYQQYLNLTAPKDIDINETYTAIADGSKIYLYDGTIYKTFTHTETIDKVEFGRKLIEDPENAGQYIYKDFLFFMDTSTNLYSLDLDDFLTRLWIGSCSDFTFVDSETPSIYFISKSVSTIKVQRMSSNENTSSAEKLNPIDGMAGANFSITSIGINVYYSVDKNIYQAGSTTATMTTEENISKLVAYNDISTTYLGYTLTTNNTKLYRYNSTNTNIEVASIDGNFSGVKFFDKNLYLISLTSIKKYDLVKDEMTNFEICSSSASVNRLNNAKGIDYLNNKLYIADYENSRISIYDIKTETYSAVNCIYSENTFKPEYVCAGENYLLSYSIVDGWTYIYLYTNNTQTWSLIESTDRDQIVGATYVFGSFYIIDGNKHFYRYDTNNPKAPFKSWTKAEITGLTAEHITSDIYGNIYVAFKGVVESNVCYQIKKYSEQQFASNYQPNDTQCTFTVPNILSIDVDFDGNYYALTNDNKLLVNDTSEYSISFDGLIYETDISSVGFALNFENKDVYFLAPNLIASTNKLDIHNATNIDVENADEEIFSNTSVGVNEVSIVHISSNSTCIEFKLSELQNSEIFPYTRYYRQLAETNAVKLGEVGDYNIVVIYNNKTREYSANLVKKTYCEDVQKDEYLVSSNSSQVAFTSNAVYLYKYPYLTASLSIKRLPKSTTIIVLGEINLKDELDYNYSYVQYTEDGINYTGYIPTTFLISIQAIKSDDYSTTFLFLQDNALRMTANDGKTTIVKRGTRLQIYNNPNEEGQYLAVYKDADGKEFYANISVKSVTPSGFATVKALVLAMIGLFAVLLVICYLVILQSSRTYYKKT